MSSPVKAAALHLRARHRAERRFRAYGFAAIALALAFLVVVLAVIGVRGAGAFRQTQILLDADLTALAAEREALSSAEYNGIVRDALRARFPDVTGRSERRELMGLISPGAEFELREKVLDEPVLAGSIVPVWLPASGDLDLAVKGEGLANPPAHFSENETAWARQLEAEGRLQVRFNVDFLTHGDSRNPELAGILSAVAGSFFTLTVCLLLSFFLGVTAAIYLEEFAPKNRLTGFIEVNINNLAAVPSIIFGLLGLAIFLNFFGLPRSAALVGGMVLALMTLPTIIIASRAALQSVPPSIREGALALGASAVQTTFRAVVPLALPGMLTGTIIGMARALGETAPLIMIGMVAFIADVPSGFTDPAVTLPVQVYLWADSPERAFVEKTAGAIIVLLVFLIAMNLAAVIMRKKYEIRW